MKILNAEELINELTPKLKDYLEEKLGPQVHDKKFMSYLRDGNTPSMNFIENDTLVYCHATNKAHNIFMAYSFLEGTPVGGPSWYEETLAALAKHFSLRIVEGELSPAEQHKAFLLSIFRDAAEILSSYKQQAEPYVTSRQWSSERLVIGSISEDDLVSSLKGLGYSQEQIIESRILGSSDKRVFGANKITFLLKDHWGRPVGFISRKLEGDGPKYLHSHNNDIFNKSNFLFGLDIAYREARSKGLFIVEGPGDVAAMHKHQRFNTVAALGVAVNANHLERIKMLGIKNVYLCLDWDEAGQKSTERVLTKELNEVQGLNIFIVNKPEGFTVSDLDEYLSDPNYPENGIESLVIVPAFKWILEYYADSISPEGLASKVIPSIAAEPSAVKRELLTKTLASHLNVSYFNVYEDVEYIRNKEEEQKNEKVRSAAKMFSTSAIQSPKNIQSLLFSFQDEIEKIESEGKSRTTGSAYQLEKFHSLQLLKQEFSESSDSGEFKMKYFQDFSTALSGSQDYTLGCLAYVGGRANSGKTASCIALAVDVLVSDPDALVVCHFTDDSYIKIEPRFKSALYCVLKSEDHVDMTIGNFARPYTCTEAQNNINRKVEQTIKHYLETEKLTIIDIEDGPFIASLEKNIRYLRNKYPEKKLFILSDNTHNYEDFMDLEQTTRMKRISTLQKKITVKYRAFMLATVEYRKFAAKKKDEMVLPTNEDIADSRALEYQADVIIHVYNDLKDRGDNANIVWWKRGSQRPLPRLLWVFGKNKISDFDDKLVVDLDPSTVFVNPINSRQAREESARVAELQKEGRSLDNILI